MRPYRWLLIPLLLASQVSWAHPMGNFSINHYAGLDVGADELRLRYIIDYAEIPAFQEIQAMDRDADGVTSDAERVAYLARQEQALAQGMEIRLAGRVLRLTPRAHALAFPPGMGGLPTLRLTLDYAAQLGVALPDAANALALDYRDRNYARRAGWKEIAARAGAGVILVDSPLPAQGSELRAYPADAALAPPQAVAARLMLSAGAGGATAHAPSPAATRPADAFAALIKNGMPHGAMFVVTLCAAVALGALHALSPGHGKTLVAAYLVGSHGTARHAFALGLIVTFAHTAGVLLLGLVTLYLSQYVLPEQIYPWLSMFSGLTIAFIGAALLRQRWSALWGRRRIAHYHAARTVSPLALTTHGDQLDLSSRTSSLFSRAHTIPQGSFGAVVISDSEKHLVARDHPALHTDHHHHHHHVHHSLLGIGLSGGIVPCPSALVVLLSALALHQLAFGLVLIVAFSAGLAATLVGLGLAVVYLGGWVRRVPWGGHVAHLLPAFSAAAMTVLGCVLALQAWGW